MPGDPAATQIALVNGGTISADGSNSPRPLAVLPLDQAAVAESVPSFWGGNWAARFAANFTQPPDQDDDPAAAALADLVNRAIQGLAEPGRQVIVDYHILCLSRRAIALRLGLTEQEINNVRARAERRLKRMLAGVVSQRFGVKDHGAGDCPLCVSAHRAEIDRFLASRRLQDSWAALRRAINERFELTVKRVQVIMAHCRDHTPAAEEPQTPTFAGAPRCPKRFV